MSAEERIELALRLGEDDLDAYMRSHGCDREHALRVLRRSRRSGRRHSAVMEALDP
jgi:hypothetical protein